MRQVLFLLLTTITFISCDQVVIVIDNVPDNTPAKSTLYVAGNFNYWDPGDSYFPLEKLPDGTYYIKMPKGTGEIEFNFTRGDWTTGEGDLCGNRKDIRRFTYGTQDTLHVNIESWQDLDPVNCPQVTFMINQFPEITPINENIYLTGSFNAWDPDNSDYAFVRKDSGYYITLEFDDRTPEIEYKVTRGDWSKTEANKYGIEVQKRNFVLGRADSISIEIHGWTDLISEEPELITFIVTSLPDNTPEYEPIYLVGNLNGWYPRDINYTLSVNKQGQPYISIPKPPGDIEYKFTRGSWYKVEGDVNGERLPDRIYKEASADTVYVEIASWEDLIRDKR